MVRIQRILSEEVYGPTHVLHSHFYYTYYILLLFHAFAALLFYHLAILLHTLIF